MIRYKLLISISFCFLVSSIYSISSEINTNKIIQITTTYDEVSRNRECSLREAIMIINGQFSDCKILHNPNSSINGYTIVIPKSTYYIESKLSINTSLPVYIYGNDSVLIGYFFNTDLNFLEIKSNNTIELNDLIFKSFMGLYPSNSGFSSALYLNVKSAQLNRIKLLDNYGNSKNPYPLYFEGDTLIVNEMEVSENKGGIKLNLKTSSAYVEFNKILVHHNTQTNYDNLGAIDINFSADGASLVLINSTISENIDLSGIYTSNTGYGNLDLLYTTITKNSHEGIVVKEIQSLTIENSIFSDNSIGYFLELDISIGGLSIEKFIQKNIIKNLDDWAYIFGIDENTNYINVDPKLKAIDDNAGFTRSYLPSSNSIAIDSGVCNTHFSYNFKSKDVDPMIYTIEEDQRGEPRPGTYTDTEKCDIGSIESQTEDYPIVVEPIEL